jgi:hypothetical protein
LPCLNSGGALWSLIRPRWISLVAVQCVLLWSIPKTGIDLPQSRLAVVTLSQATSQALKKSAINIPIQEKSHGSN